MGLEKRTNGCANAVNEEHCRRSRNLLLINRLKTKVSVRSSRDGVGIGLIPLSHIRFIKLRTSSHVLFVVRFHFVMLYSNSQHLVHVLAEEFRRKGQARFSYEFFLGTVKKGRQAKRVSLARSYALRCELPGHFSF